jgi:hypothetical protein
MLSAFAQEGKSCDSLYLQNTALIKTNDPCLLTATDYVLVHPLYGNSWEYDRYMRFILSWMEKTPDFTFSLNDNILGLCKDENLLLFNVYLTCLTKAAIKEKKDYLPVALSLFATYLKKPENKVKQTIKIKKLIADVENNKLEKYL